MVAFILPANSATGGYEISNSLRFNDGDSPRLALNPASTGNQDRWTLSLWVKRSTLGAAQCFFASTDGSATSFDAKFDANDSLDVYNYLGGGFGARLVTNRKFRDVAAWYHIVIVYDSGNSTEAQRLRIYVNGTEESSFSTTNYPSLNEDSDINVNGSTVEIGRQGGGSQFFDGYMAEIFLIDGTVYSPTDFGETDDNGVWVPIDAKDDLTFGTNGFYFEFKQTGTGTNASGMGADTSGETNHYAPTNLAATDVTTDTPTNNFATYNSLRPNNQATLSEGNVFVSGVTGGSTSMEYHQLSTILVNRGKWYWEMKITANNTISANSYIGCGYWDDSDSTHGTTIQGCLVVSGTSNVRGGGSYGNTATFQSSLPAPVQNDIYGFAVNCDDEEITFFRNGSAHGNADNDYSGLSAEQKLLGPYAAHGGSSQLQNIYLNTGNPAFAISSGNTDGNGYGNFEFAPPSGYFALCTKNLAEYG